MKTTTTLYSYLAALGLTFGLGTQPALAFVNVAVLPTNQVVLVGSNAVFNAQVTTTAGETITGYAWQIATNVSGPFNPVPGATTSTCTLTNVQTTGTNYCFARVTYNSGADVGLVSVSPAVTWVVLDQARIITQPQGGLIRPTGSNATFSVSAAGSAPLTYQWRLNGVNLANGTRITGATGTNLTVNALVTGDSGSYVVVVSNSSSAATSQVATLSVFAPVGISVPLPSTNYVILGSNAVFSVTTTGTPPLGFQWRQNGTNLVNGGRISGATSNVLTIAAIITNDVSGFSVFITNPVSALTSSVATLTVLVPATFTSATNLTWRQGLFLSFTNTATGTLPMMFGAAGLPAGLSIEPTNGVISGIPLVTGVFDIAVYATNAFYPGNAGITTTGQLALTLTTGVPGITSALFASGKQGNNFNYTIVASNNPASFSASALPTGLSFDPATGVISGVPIVSGTFTNTIGVANSFGSDSQVLTLNLASALPVITSARTASWPEGQSGFKYTIRASNTDALTRYGASDLPLGLTFNTTNGVISGTPWSGGTYTIPIWAANAWGTGLTNLVLTVSYTTPGGLAIMDVTPTFSKPYLLDFSFSLRDGPDSAINNPVVRPPSQLQVVCMEDGVPIGSEAPMILQSASAKQLKTFLVLDYTYSMFVVPGAIDAMQGAAELLINEQPSHALFGVVEFNADYMTPQFVTNRLTTTNNYFITDKTVLGESIDGIQTNYVQGNYAGSRCWDAMNAALKQFGTNNPDEQRYLVVMTDGNDEASLLNGSDPLTAVTNLFELAQTNHVKIYCVGYGNNVNTEALQLLTSETGGHYYLAATTADLGAQFQRILKELDGQYVLRWATLKRANQDFQPSFQVSYAGFADNWNTKTVYKTNEVVDTNQTPWVTNYVQGPKVPQVPYNPPKYSNDVRVGSLRLVTDAEVGPQTIRLRATYVPRFVRQIQFNYRANYPCTASLDSTNSNEILFGWTMTETNDGAGLRTLTMTSSDTNNLLTSIPYAAFGDLVSFDFAYPESLTATQAFSVLSLDNSIYTNVQPSGIRFTNENFTNFVMLYTNAPPPHGTPIPWLINYGFTNDFDAAELIATNGLPVWQDYLAGLNPLDPNSRFAVWTTFAPGQTPQISFSTVMGRTYRVECATSVDSWFVLRDNIPGNGGTILFIDNRVLSGVSAQFYRVAVY